MKEKQIRAFQKTILDFYRTSGRDFSWRRTIDPYHILVSEIMLQQTQVKRVEEKYPEFIKRFPTVSKLARAHTQSVLKVWQGMGYNRRALNLHKAAQKIVKEHGGIVPKTMEKLVALPGVGLSTAGGVLAYAYNIPVVFIETNIRRVYIHHFFPEQESIPDNALLPYIEQTLDRNNPRQWYWALMDYGTHLSSITVNPNRRSKHYSQQSTFEGSVRQVRGEILRQSLAGSYDPDVIAARLRKTPKEVGEIEKEMRKEGLIA